MRRKAYAVIAGLLIFSAPLHARKFLLPKDADALIAAADASGVLK